MKGRIKGMSMTVSLIETSDPLGQQNLKQIAQTGLTASKTCIGTVPTSSPD